MSFLKTYCKSHDPLRNPSAIILLDAARLSYAVVFLGNTRAIRRLTTSVQVYGERYRSQVSAPDLECDHLPALHLGDYCLSGAAKQTTGDWEDGYAGLQRTIPR